VGGEEVAESGVEAWLSEQISPEGEALYTSWAFFFVKLVPVWRTDKTREKQSRKHFRNRKGKALEWTNRIEIEGIGISHGAADCKREVFDG